MAANSRNLWPVFWLGYGACLIILLHRLYAMWMAGGTSWQQADWLISFSEGPIRRGLSGEVFIALSDIFATDVVAVICLFQAILVVAVFGGVRGAVHRIGLSARLALLLMSPAFLAFWVYDPLAGFRKELLGYCAFLPLLACAAQRISRRVAFVISFAVYATSVTFHEVNAFLAPFLLVGVALCLNDLSQWRRVIPWGIAMAAVGLLGLGFAARFASVSSAASLCMPVLERGASPDICDGIFTWLEWSTDKHREVALGFAGRIKLEFVILSYLIGLLPFVILFARAPKQRQLTGLVVASGLVFAPLIVMTVDWGRWIAMNYAAVTFVTLVGLLRFRPEWAGASVNRPVFGASALLFLTYGMWHVSAGPIPGLVPSLIIGPFEMP